MAMAMTDDYYAADLDDFVHRLLPREILADVGIVETSGGVPPSPCTVSRRDDEHTAAVVEDIAAHLVRILGLDATRGQQRASRPHLQHPRAGMGYESRAPAGGGHGAAARHAPAAPCWNGTAPRVPRLEMAAAVNSHPPARCHGTGTGTGTGVFLPRAEAYAQNRASSTSPMPMNGAKPSRMQRREAAVVVAMQQQQQQQLLQLRAMAAEMQRQREAFAAALQFQGCHAIAPPQQWMY